MLKYALKQLDTDDKKRAIVLWKFFLPHRYKVYCQYMRMGMSVKAAFKRGAA
jgi:hypothetical protein